jgi:hypothetical protein
MFDLMHSFFPQNRTSHTAKAVPRRDKGQKKSRSFFLEKAAPLRLALTRHFATALSRLLNALQAGNFGCLPTGAVLAILQQASQAPSINEVNG